MLNLTMIVFSAIYLLLLLFKTLSAKKYIKDFPQPKQALNESTISILQPILSGDPTLSSTLAGNVINFPHCEFIWLVDENDQVAQEVVNALKAKYPKATIKQHLYAQAPDGINPKLFKLEDARKRCSGEYCVVLDDDTVLSNNGMRALIESLDKHQLSTGLPMYREGANVPSKLLAQFVNNNSALTYLSVLPYMEPLSINGMCYAIKTKTLAAYGGFEPILSHLTDDLALANHVQSKGGNICQTPYVQEIETQIPGMKDYIQQMHRWYLFATLLMRQQAGVTNLIIGLLHGLPSLLLWGMFIVLLSAPSVLVGGLLILTLVSREYLLSHVRSKLTDNQKSHIALSILSEILQPLHLIHAVIVRKIKWRTRRYRVYENNRFVKV